MPAKTTEKGELGEAMVLADLMRQGHEVAIPFGHNQPYDLIVTRKEDGRLERVQVKYTESDGKVVQVRVESTSAWVRHKYHRGEVDWIATYDATTQLCFYVPSSIWDGHARLSLRLVPTANGQAKLVRHASDFLELAGSLERIDPSGTGANAYLPFDTTPE